MYNEVIRVLEKILQEGIHNNKVLTEIERQNIKNSIEYIKRYRA